VTARGDRLGAALAVALGLGLGSAGGLALKWAGWPGTDRLTWWQAATLPLAVLAALAVLGYCSDRSGKGVR
jgi:hypothetical protein